MEKSSKLYRKRLAVDNQREKKMRVLFMVNIPSPYRVDFFDELGKLCDLTVLYERKNASDRELEE